MARNMGPRRSPRELSWLLPPIVPIVLAVGCQCDSGRRFSEWGAFVPTKIGDVAMADDKRFVETSRLEASSDGVPARTMPAGTRRPSKGDMGPENRLLARSILTGMEVLPVGAGAEPSGIRATATRPAPASAADRSPGPRSASRVQSPPQAPSTFLTPGARGPLLGPRSGAFRLPPVQGVEDILHPMRSLSPTPSPATKARGRLNQAGIPHPLCPRSGARPGR